MVQEKINATLLKKNHISLQRISDDLSYLSIQIPRKLKLVNQIDGKIEQKKNILEALKKTYYKENKPNLEMEKKIIQLFEELEGLAIQKCNIGTQCSNAVDRHIPIIEKQISHLSSFIQKQNDENHQSQTKDNNSIYMKGQQSSKRQTNKRFNKMHNHPHDTDSFYGSVISNSRTNHSHINNNNISSQLQYQINSGSNKLSNSYVAIDHGSPYDSRQQLLDIQTLDYRAGEVQKQEQYCICRNSASFDENMIACDAEGCEIEWFHIKCVFRSVAEYPGENQAWICPVCKEKNPQYREM